MFVVLPDGTSGSACPKFAELQEKGVPGALFLVTLRDVLVCMEAVLLTPAAERRAPPNRRRPPRLSSQTLDDREDYRDHRAGADRAERDLEVFACNVLLLVDHDFRLSFPVESCVRRVP
jgi:hypothetical protein